ncbi:type I-C CRISPR-associated protein Cas8c/Csd1 [Alkanindiges illinoisensis]|uniref:Type I-C CRISPR-associated protein Cas8c/Csd1 n=1 Tax=Alkanindiges illinoisensis TaxID=197183 RepID=A0A4Y7XEF9_9GAMM|nr:type I-C CRISPR-associated protein Cas8c/Csd1 [Alkanindiges illinoisensis]TEU30168.1 type I-C CRISPR-associated protein Cas8c/Csd1 [Alkanindiges illinoisensis]
MILQKLNDLYERLNEQGKVATRGYAVAKIDFCLILNQAGELAAINDLRLPDKRRSALELIAPQGQTRTVGIKSNFLWDKTAYVLGVSTTSKRSQEEHQNFKNLHFNALAQNEDLGLQALVSFLQEWQPEHYTTHPVIQPFTEELIDKNVVFRLEGETLYLHDRPIAKDIWASLQAEETSVIGQCLVSGRQAPLARLHPAIKGVDGGQSSGAMIVSFNKNSFESFGKTQGENSPMSEQATFAYTIALNYLLRRSEGNQQRLKIGDAVTVFWAEANNASQAEQAELFVAALFAPPPPTDEQETQSLSGLIKQIASGRPLSAIRPDLDPYTRFYILGLSPNAARISVRFWQQSTLGQLSERISEHYQDLYLEPIPWRTPPSIASLTLATVPHRAGQKPKFDDVSPLLAGDLARAIFTGQRYPQSLLAQLLLRMRSDGQITSLRVALCKAVINRAARLSQQFDLQTKNHKEIPMSLDVTETNPAYRLGRLFAVLESIQRKALGDSVNATIRDRYWGAASATPASIFPMLLRNAANHLGKIRKENPGLSSFFDWQIGDIEQGLSTSWPKSLNMNDQGRFAIGYYHQKWTKTIKTKEGEEVKNEMAESLPVNDGMNNTEE